MAFEGVCTKTFSITGRSSSASMDTLVLVTQVLVHRCRSRTYEFLGGSVRRNYLHKLLSSILEKWRKTKQDCFGQSNCNMHKLELHTKTWENNF